MAFFSKLKDRLFKSSSKLDEGLDAIVEEGGEESVEETPVAPTPEPAPEATPEPASEAPSPAPSPEPIPEPDAEATPQGAPKGGILARLTGRATGAGEIKRVLDDDMLEQLEELLIASDMGVDTALRVTANIAEGRFGKRLSARQIKELLAEEIARIMEPVAKPLPIYPTTPQVVLVVGVNGSGKTTSDAKLRALAGVKAREISDRGQFLEACAAKEGPMARNPTTSWRSG